nr:cadherin-like beta sandwich domain-containing protein [uncultured Caproiciproducens sp.]
MKRHCVDAFFLLSLFLLVILRIPANAATMPYFTYSLDKESVACGELVKLQINAGQTPDTAAGFRMRVAYNTAELSFVRTETSSQIKSGTMVTNSTANPICSVYVCNVDKGVAPELSGNIISFVFQVKNGTSAGKTTIGAHIDEVCDYQAKQLDVDIQENLTVNIEPQAQTPSDEAVLSELEPFQGVLVPEFSPDVFQYRMYVKYNVESVEFYASAQENGTVKINRKTLLKAGTDTPIVATVTSANKETKTQYVILVSRADKPNAVAGESSGVATQSEKTSRPAKTTSEQAGQSGDGLTAGTVTVGKDGSPENFQEAEPEQQPVQEMAQQSAITGHADRNIYIIGNQMPIYLVGMLTAALCIMIGISLSFYLKIKPRN